MPIIEDNTVDKRSLRFVELKITPLLKSNDFNKALFEIRKLMKNRSTPELKEIEIVTLYASNNISEAIRKGKDYLNSMRNNLKKASIAGAISMIYHEIGNKEEEI